jgi:SIR2-like domain/TIR domain
LSHQPGDSDVLLDGETAARQLKIFMNYRHEDTQGTAWGVYWPLEARFGRDNVFFDNGKLRAGEEFLKEIDQSLDAADVMIVLIGPSWQRIMSERLRRDDKDYVAHEIGRALLRGPGLTVIPLLVDEAAPPDARVLPLSLKRLASCHVERIRHTDLREDVGQLIGRLCEIAADAGLIVQAGDDGLDDFQIAPRPPEKRVRAIDEPGELVAHAPVPVVEVPGRAVDAPVPVVEVPGPAVDAPVPVVDTPVLVVEGSAPRPQADDAPAIVAPAPDRLHYEEIAEEAVENGIVLFLGSEVNAEDSSTLPDDEMLARYISGKVKLDPSTWDLAEVAQHARALRGEQRVFQLVREGLAVEPAPGHVHQYIAGLPQRLAELGREKRYQMIVTPKYDDALERAFRERSEPFDVVVYMGTGTESPGKFVHIPWGRDPVTISVPNTYRGLPILSDMSLEHTLIVRIHGAVDDPDLNFNWRDNYVVTEDHYIQYLSGSPATAVIPGQIIEKLRSASCLFLGYTMSDWRLRVFLKRIWPGERLGNGTHWAVERAPTRLEEKLCFAAGVKLYQSSLTDYVDGFDGFLKSPAGQQALP